MKPTRSVLLWRKVTGAALGSFRRVVVSTAAALGACLLARPRITAETVLAQQVCFVCALITHIVPLNGRSRHLRLPWPDKNSALSGSQVMSRRWKRPLRGVSGMKRDDWLTRVSCWYHQQAFSRVFYFHILRPFVLWCVVCCWRFYLSQHWLMFSTGVWVSLL